MPHRSLLLVPRLHAALARQKAAIEKILARAADGFSSEDLHDVRVALRRTSGIAQLARGVPSKGDGDALHAAARDLRRLLSGSRTAEVSRALLEERAKKDKGHAPLLRRFARELGDGNGHPSRRDLAIRVALLRAAFARREADLTPGRKARSIGPGAPLERALRERVEKRLAKKRKAMLKIGVPDTESVHALRIAAKQLRYALEPLRDVLPGAEELLDALRAFQTVAGDAHDRIELADLVGKRAEKLAARDRVGGASVSAALGREASRCVGQAQLAAPGLLALVQRARLTLPR